MLEARSTVRSVGFTIMPLPVTLAVLLPTVVTVVIVGVVAMVKGVSEEIPDALEQPGPVTLAVAAGVAAAAAMPGRKQVPDRGTRVVVMATSPHVARRS